MAAKAKAWSKMSVATDFLTLLNLEYETRHTAKEDAFWSAYMGLADDAKAARKRFGELEIELKRWLRNPELAAAVEAALETGDASEDERVALRGWQRTFAAHGIAGEEAQALSEEIVEAEAALANARASMKLGYELEGEFHPASSVKLGLMVRSGKSNEERKAAWEGLRSIEQFVLDNGFVELVRQRNRLGRMLGGEDFYDWTVRRVEGLSKNQIFDLLDDLEARTRDAARLSIEALKGRHGEETTPWNISHLVSGDVTKALDPYFPIGDSVARWVKSFAAMGIDYRGATLVLDLLDRPGKYENGFMHGPVPAWRGPEGHRPARIHFTANAVPGQVGAGQRALQTLLHEGGHAAHFANIDMPAPCFAQEFAPTSVAFAETQSMFLDSVLDDADWLTRYAKRADGAAVPFELIERAIRAKQPFAAWTLRSMMVVPYAERAIYEIPDDELSASRILEVIREVEARILSLEGGAPRPVLSVPHLLSGESSAYYHGYVLAQIAVYQTRAHFLERDGHLVDNAKIGPELTATYWRPGNSETFMDFVAELTGRPLSAEDLAGQVSRSADEAVDSARQAIAKLAEIPEFDGAFELGAKVEIVHGSEQVASSVNGFEALANDFASWVGKRAAGA